MDAYRKLAVALELPMPQACGGKWDGHTSYNDVIAHLLDLVDQHRARAKKSRINRAAKRKASKGTQGE